MVKIEAYEPFLIGIKLIPGISLDSVKKKMRKILKEKGYMVPEEPIEMPIKIGLPIEILGIKDDVEVNLNIDTQAFNIIGEEPDNVKSIFKEVLNFLPNLGFSSYNDIIHFYEILAIMGIKTDKNPIEVLDGLLHVDINNLKRFNPELSIIGVRIGLMKIELEKHDHIDLTIEPKIGSPTERYWVQLRYQSKNEEKLMEFQLENEVKKVMLSLEG